MEKVIFRAGFIGLIGHPNAGKSTLMNAVIGEKVSIVTRKPQTTRQRISGIYNGETSQAIFLDAPGVVEASKGLNGFLSEEYRNVIDDSDALVAVLNLDARTFKEIEAIVQLVEASGKPWIACITKIDLKKVDRLLMLENYLRDKGVKYIQVSAKNKPDETQSLLADQLTSLLPESLAPLYDPELFTTHSLREITSELIREKCFEFLHNEIPYGLAVQILKFEEGDQLNKIYADIVVSKDGHKPMVIGENGKKLRMIGQTTRLELEKFLDKKIFLQLHVNVKKNWCNSELMMKDFGYESRIL